MDWITNWIQHSVRITVINLTKRSERHIRFCNPDELLYSRYSLINIEGWKKARLSDEGDRMCREIKTKRAHDRKEEK